MRALRASLPLAAALLAGAPLVRAQAEAFDAAASLAASGDAGASRQAVECFLRIEPSLARDERQAAAAALAFEAGEFERCIAWAGVAEHLGRATSASRTAGWRSLVALSRTSELVRDLRRATGSDVDAEVVALLAREEAGLAPLADASMRAGRIEEGLWLFAAIAERLPADSVRLCNAGLALRHAGRLDDSLRCYERALQVAPGDGFAWNDYGLLLRVRGDRAGARTAFARALALDSRRGEGPAITNVVVESVLQIADSSTRSEDPTALASEALANRPDAALLRRAVIDWVLRSHRQGQLQQLPDNRAAGR